VNLEFDSSLPYNVLGRTSVPRYSNDEITVSVGDKFFEMGDKQQYKTILHECIHVKQFRDEIDEWLEDKFNASDEFIREVEKSSNPLYRKDVEGITEVLTDTILPFDVGTGYPYEKRRKDAELEAKGFDVESELVENMEDEFDRLIDNYKNIYSSFEIGSLYIENGEFNGKDYLAIIPDGGESSVNEYLTEISSEEDYTDFLEARKSSSEEYLA